MRKIDKLANLAKENGWSANDFVEAITETITPEEEMDDVCCTCECPKKCCRCTTDAIEEIVNEEFEEVMQTAHLPREKYIELFVDSLNNIARGLVDGVPMYYRLERMIDKPDLNMSKMLQNIAEEFECSIEAMITRIISTTKSKNSDYAMDDDAFSNFNFANLFGVTTEDAILTFISTKMARYENLVANKKNPNNESIKDTLLDLFIYLIIYDVYTIASQNDEENLLPIVEDINQELIQLEGGVNRTTSKIDAFIKKCDPEEDAYLIKHTDGANQGFKQSFKKLRSEFNV